ncbi:hypothetical protein PPL_11840 [Heterostelium album PN500]|uniref:B box-type domain-containing protein n=1 Tax=Heterostelium pallidum (strain ATCC 26659 / Pp 5 / PN500) TaxID=670386 RepID=D3BUL9_HETP5|nr:hypothetical protein PPL_11840 [Heterostelium album PN500]EFA74807.1 hypothetical protein PPL_11840 [Heterostelium album PN500]|eukprot:XP_020426941.1 hypothetical protein PPL_11840 [Heterostelium album PN500]
MSNNHSNNKCIYHNDKQLELICFECNLLFCTKCVAKHSGHSLDNIESVINNIDKDIKSDTDKNKNNNNNSGGGGCGKDRLYNVNNIKTMIGELWEMVKSKSEMYQTLATTESDISSCFSDLHQYLMVEEHRLKKLVIENKEILEHQIEINIDQLKSLNILLENTKSFCNNNNNNKNKDKDNDSDKDNENDNNNDNQNKDNDKDTTDRYQINHLITSIQQSLKVDDFFAANNDTIFFVDDKQSFNDDCSLLNQFLQHSNKFKDYKFDKSSNNNNSDDNNKQDEIQIYSLRVKREAIDSIKSVLKSSLVLQVHVKRPVDETNKRYIFSTDHTKNVNRVALIDITSAQTTQYTIEYLKDVEMEDWWSFNSAVRVGDYVYRFGGGFVRSNRYQRFSLLTRSFDLDEPMGDAETSSYVSVCYDGHDHIYLLDGSFRDSTQVTRYTVSTKQFEKCTVIPNTQFHHFSFYYNGLIYSVIPNQKLVMTIDPTTNFQVWRHTLNVAPYFSKNHAYCTDGKGGLYMLSDLQFFYVNLVTKQTRKLQACTIREKQNIFNKLAGNKTNVSANNQLLYSEGSNGVLIYLLQGMENNYVYSVRNDTWISILNDDKSNREYCASVML